MLSANPSDRAIPRVELQLFAKLAIDPLQLGIDLAIKIVISYSCKIDGACSKRTINGR